MTEKAHGPVVRARRKPSLSKRIKRAPFGVGAAGALLTGALKFVYATNRVTFEPAQDAPFRQHAPFILASWHGQAFMLPAVRPPAWPVDVLVSKSTDAEVMARVATNLGLGVIRGSGAADPERMFEKGGIEAFRVMKASLEQGRTVALTADFMPSARRKVSPGLILLARLTGRPIVPIAVASSRCLTLNSWDRTTITLPFGHTAFVAGEAITVPRQGDEGMFEAARLALEARLNAVFERADEIVGRRRG